MTNTTLNFAKAVHAMTDHLKTLRLNPESRAAYLTRYEAHRLTAAIGDYLRRVDGSLPVDVALVIGAGLFFLNGAHLLTLA